jgi:hypothetical protein
MSNRHLFSIIILVLLLTAACGNNSPNTIQNQSRGGDAAINWVRSPETIVFRINVVGGNDTFDKRNDIPLCTIYGDNRIVWTDNTQPGRTPVMFDVLTDIQIYDFITDLSVNKRLFTYESFANVQPQTDEIPVYEQIVINVNDVEHITDGFEAWPSDYFRDILADCQTLSQAPARFEPAGGWLSAQFTEYDPNATIITWDAEASGINLLGMAELERTIWVDDANVPILWNIMVNSPRRRLFSQQGNYVEVAFQVPNVHLDAPQAPAPDELEAARELDPSDELENIDFGGEDG